MNLPKVTISIPTYNQEKYIARAIKSAIAQSYPNLQVIVSDDFSLDNTFEIAKTFISEKVKVFQNKDNLGRVSNYRHLLYDLSEGEWVVNLDGDDYYNDNTFIAEAVSLLGQYPESVMYVAGASSQDEGTQKIRHAPIHLSKNITLMKGTNYVLNFYNYGQIGQHFSVVYNRQLAKKTNFYVLDCLGADTDSICRLALKGDVIIQKKWVGVWTSHRLNASYTLNKSNINKELIMLDHIGEAAKKVISKQEVELWLKNSKMLKIKSSIFASLPSLDFAPAFKLLISSWNWKKQDVKELVKLFLKLLKI